MWHVASFLLCLLRRLCFPPGNLYKMLSAEPSHGSGPRVQLVTREEGPTLVLLWEYAPDCPKVPWAERWGFGYSFKGKTSWLCGHSGMRCWWWWHTTKALANAKPHSSSSKGSYSGAKDSIVTSCKNFSQPPLQMKLLEGFRWLLKLAMEKGDFRSSFSWSTHTISGAPAAFAHHEVCGNNVLRLEE